MTLNPDCLWKPDSTRDRWLTVQEGRLWATRPGEGVDHILEAGDTLELKGRGWVVQALGVTPSVFSSSPVGIPRYRVTTRLRPVALAK